MFQKKEKRNIYNSINRDVHLFIFFWWHRSSMWGGGRKSGPKFLSANEQRDKGHCHRLENSELTHLARPNGHIFVLFFICNTKMCFVSFTFSFPHLHLAILFSMLFFSFNFPKKSSWKTLKKEWKLKYIKKENFHGNYPCSTQTEFPDKEFKEITRFEVGLLLYAQ